MDLNITCSWTIADPKDAEKLMSAVKAATQDISCKDFCFRTGCMEEDPPEIYSDLLVWVPGIELHHPIPVSIRRGDGEYVISWPLALLYGSGDSLESARAMLQQEILTRYQDMDKGGMDPNVAATLKYYGERMTPASKYYFNRYIR